MYHLRQFQFILHQSLDLKSFVCLTSEWLYIQDMNNLNNCWFLAKQFRIHLTTSCFSSSLNLLIYFYKAHNYKLLIYNCKKKKKKIPCYSLKCGLLPLLFVQNVANKIYIYYPFIAQSCEILSNICDLIHWFRITQ